MPTRMEVKQLDESCESREILHPFWRTHSGMAKKTPPYSGRYDFIRLSARHWQQIESGRPITVSTLLRICAVFETSLERLVRGLDSGIYKDGDLS